MAEQLNVLTAHRQLRVISEPAPNTALLNFRRKDSPPGKELIYT